MPPATPAKEDEVVVDASEDAVRFLSESISDEQQPVVLFALDWCEFCGSVRKMFAAYDIPYRAIDLDSLEYQAENRGGNIRAALRERTASRTIPQIFMGGQTIGGATELFDACKDGSMQTLLDESSVSFNQKVDVDPYSFLPGWLQTR